MKHYKMKLFSHETAPFATGKKQNCGAPPDTLIARVRRKQVRTNLNNMFV
jgi:hypothetical protein